MHQQSNVLRYLLPLVAFTIAYGIASTAKPFHVDEFFSWVYAERCSYRDILLLRESGIGHPPLFHLLHKMAMDMVPGCHPIEVRLVNFITGILFVFLMTRQFAGYGAPTYYLVGISLSAAVLNVFVFARMWGLVCLASLLLFWAGESYARSAQPWKLILLAGACIFGFLSDYNFILMMPYLLYVIADRHVDFGIRKYVYGGLVSLLVLATIYKLNPGSGAVLHSIYHFARSIPKIAFELTNAVVNFWFLEPFLMALLIISIALFFGRSSKMRLLVIDANLSKAHLFWILIVFLTAVEALLRFSNFQNRYMFPVVVLFGVGLLICSVKVKQFTHELSAAASRSLHAMAGAMILLLVADQLLWRDLRDARFLTLLLPQLFLYFLWFMNRKTLRLFSGVLVISGVVYLTSSAVGDYFPPPAMEGVGAYRNVFAYSTQHLKHCSQNVEDPLFVDTSEFDRFCPLCRIGQKLELHEMEGPFVISGFHDDNIPALLKRLQGMKLERRMAIGLSTTDRFQFEHFEPLHNRRPALFVLVPSEGR